MKTKLVLAGLAMALSFSSCKDNDKDDKKTEQQPAAADAKSQTFDIAIDVVIPSDEELILFYKDGTNDWFQDDKTVWAGVKGSTNVQTAVFHLPEGVLPNDIRLDVGRNEFKGLAPIEIKKITMTYLDKKFEIPQDQIANYFKANQFIAYDEATKKYSFKKDEKGGYDPFFETKPEFYPQLANLAL